MDRRVDVRHFVHRRSCDISSSNMAAYERWPRVSARGTKYSSEVCRMAEHHAQRQTNLCRHISGDLANFDWLISVFLNLGVATNLGSPSDFRGVARLSTNFLKNDIRTEKCWPNSPTYSTDVGVLRGWGRAQITVRHFGSRGKKG